MMRNGRRGARALATTALAGVLVVGLASCGDDGGGGDAPPGELRVGVGVKILSVDPHGSEIAERTTQMVVSQVFDPLVKVVDGEPTPMLAESWTNPDPNTWQFTLREDATFQDGSDLTSADAKASLDRFIAADTPLAPLWKTITAVEAPDPDTVVIRTSVPTGTLLNNLGLVYIAQQAQIESGAVEDEPVGTGPFALEEFRSGEQTVLVGNDEYWDGAPELNRVVLQEIPEVSSRLTALETGEIDATYSLPPDQMEQVEGFDGVNVETAPSLNAYFLWFNNGHEPFGDPAVRQALWHAVDFEQIQQDLYGDSAEVAQAPIPQAAFGSTQLPAYEYDPDKAKDLLAQAGFADGFESTIQWSSECCPNIRPLVQAIVSAWDKIGVTVELQEKERGQWLDDLLALNWDMNIQTGSVTTGDGDYTLGRLYTCAAERLGYCNPEYDQIVAQSQQELDPAVRAELLAEASAMLWADAPAIFPLDMTASAAWRDRVEGFGPTPTDIPDFRAVTVS